METPVTPSPGIQQSLSQLAEVADCYLWLTVIFLSTI
jgi:hypothetical protein